jgi:citrate lyase beta subunit
MLDPAIVAAIDARLDADDAARKAAFPGPGAGRQPVHTVYVPADRFDAGTLASWGAQAREAMSTHGPLPDLAEDLRERVEAKLANEPVEDLRIDFEDGYGLRTERQEDVDVRSAASIVGTADPLSVPAFVGLRMKSLEGPTRLRGIRTLDLFLETALTAGGLPDGFRVTLPKVTSVAQVEAMVELAQALESTYAIAPLPIELQVETPQAVLGPDGTALIARMLHACAGRCVGLHYGTYDYSASIGVAAAFQSMEHPAADYAKAVMQVADERAARRLHRRGPRSLGAAQPARASLAGAGLLPGLGPAPGATADALRGHLHVLPGCAAELSSTPARLPRQAGLRHPR